MLIGRRLEKVRLILTNVRQPVGPTVRFKLTEMLTIEIFATEDIEPRARAFQLAEKRFHRLRIDYSMTNDNGNFQHAELARLLGSSLSAAERREPREITDKSGPVDSYQSESSFFCKEIPPRPNLETRRQSACCEYLLRRPPPDCVESGSTICSSQLRS